MKTGRLHHVGACVLCCGSKLEMGKPAEGHFPIMSEMSLSPICVAEKAQGSVQGFVERGTVGGCVSKETWPRYWTLREDIRRRRVLEKYGWCWAVGSEKCRGKRRECKVRRRGECTEVG